MLDYNLPIPGSPGVDPPGYNPPLMHRPPRRSVTGVASSHLNKPTPGETRPRHYHPWPHSALHPMPLNLPPLSNEGRKRDVNFNIRQGGGTQVSLSPVCSVSTWNTMGLSAYSLEASASVRRNKVRANICSILDNSDILCIQETKLNENEGDAGQGALAGLRVDSVVYYSNRKRGSAGVATLIRRDFACKHLITRISLPPLLNGFALALRFVPIAQDAPAFTVVN